MTCLPGIIWFVATAKKSIGGRSIRPGKSISENEVVDLERHITDWLNDAGSEWIYVTSKKDGG